MVIRFDSVESQIVDVPVAPAGPPSGSIDLIPSRLDFGSVELGAWKDLTLTIRNNGEGPLTVTGLTSSSPQFLQVASQLPFVLQAGEEKGVTVRFQPSAAGARTATLTVASDDPERLTVDVPLSGTGVEPAPEEPEISVSPSTLDFGGVVVVALPPETQTLTVSNQGDGKLIVLSIVSDDFQFSVTASTTIPFTVLPGSSRDVDIRFLPRDTNLCRFSQNGRADAPR